MQLEYGFALDQDTPSFEVADAHSQDLMVLHEAVFDANEDLRAPFDEFEFVANDILYIERVVIEEAENFRVYAAELLEHVLRRWAQGCFMAAYIWGSEEDPQLADVLTDRGFGLYKLNGFTVYAVDLARPRPPLAGEWPLQKIARRESGSTH